MSVTDVSANSHISDDSNNLDNREEKFCFSIPFNTKQVNCDNNDEKNGHKYGMIILAVVGPKVDGNGCCDDF